jgi:hypothetical protein
MMNRISSELERKIIELWFEGFARDEIVSKFGVSGSTVSDVVNSLPNCLVTLRDIAKNIKKMNCDPKDALEGIIVRNALLAKGLDSKKMLSLIDTYDRIAAATGLQLREMIEAAEKLGKLEKKLEKATTKR